VGGGWKKHIYISPDVSSSLSRLLWSQVEVRIYIWYVRSFMLSLSHCIYVPCLESQDGPFQGKRAECAQGNPTYWFVHDGDGVRLRS
jgi:hypothetical protein